MFGFAYLYRFFKKATGSPEEPTFTGTALTFGDTNTILTFGDNNTFLTFGE